MPSWNAVSGRAVSFANEAMPFYPLLVISRPVITSTTGGIQRWPKERRGWVLWKNVKYSGPKINSKRATNSVFYRDCIIQYFPYRNKIYLVSLYGQNRWGIGEQGTRWWHFHETERSASRIRARYSLSWRPIYNVNEPSKRREHFAYYLFSFFSLVRSMSRFGLSLVDVWCRCVYAIAALCIQCVGSARYRCVRASIYI